MNEKIKNFVEYVSSDETLKEELKSTLAGKINKEEQAANIIQFARKHGHELTEEDFLAGSEGLSDDELKAVCGGGGCGCPVAGGGGGDGLWCMCIIVGTGGIEGISEFPTSQGGCVCTMGGAGATRRH